MIGKQIVYVLTYEGDLTLETVYYDLHSARKEAIKISIEGKECTIQKWIWDEHFSKKIQDTNFEEVFVSGKIV